MQFDKTDIRAAKQIYYGNFQITLPHRIRGQSLLAGLTAFLISTASHAQTTEEVPFITSPDNVTLEMLTTAGVKRGDRVIDPGLSAGASPS
jgi:hypothetical protein